MKFRYSIIMAVSMILASSALATNGTRMIGFNAQSIGRGGTGIGVFDNSSLMMTNPAGLSFLSSSILDGDFSLMVPGLKFANAVNAETKGETNYFPVIALGYVNKQEGRNWTWGLGAFTQGGMGADFALNHNLFRDQNGNYLQQKYHSKLAVMQGGGSIAYKVTPQFSVGATAHLVYSMLEFQMPYSLSPTIMRGVVNPQTGMTFGDMFAAPPTAGGFGYTEVTAAAEMNSLKGFGFSGKIGLAWTPNEIVSLGISYTSSSPITYKRGKATMDMTAQLNDAFGKAMQGYMMQNPGATQAEAQAAVMGQFSQLGIDMTKGVVANYDLQAKLKFPQSIGFGTSVKLSNSVRVSADFEWVNWKNAFDNMTLDLSNGDNANINRMLGNTGSFGVDFPMNWDDAYCVRLGTEWDASSSLTLRIGGAFGSNPVPDETVFPVFPAIVENHVMAGASWKIADPLTIHVAYELAANKTQTAAAQSAVAQEFNNSSSQLLENIFHISLSWMVQ